MTKLPLILLLLGASVGVCAAQRHPYSSRPYHPPDRQTMPRDARRPQATPPSMPAPKPQPVSVPAPKPAKRGK